MNMKVNIAGVEWKNPVTVASGTFGSGAEFAEFIDLNRLGAVTTKGVANVPWPGNPTPRVAEVYGGMMNAIGLQNPGIDLFCERDIPFLRQYDTKIIVNVCGKSAEDYCEVAERLADEAVDMLEINISCPNVKEGGIAFGQDPKAVEAITREVVRETAGDHETQSQCDGYCRDGEGCRGRRSRRGISDQHADGDEDRYPSADFCSGEPDGRRLRSSHSPNRRADGISGVPGCEGSDHRYGGDCQR